MDERLQRIFREIFRNDDLILKDDMTADDIEGWDSLQHINLIIALEKEFHIKFSLPEVKSLANIGGLKKLILEKMQFAVDENK